jgi:hypothetical protein
MSMQIIRSNRFGRSEQEGNMSTPWTPSIVSVRAKIASISGRYSRHGVPGRNLEMM